VVPRRIVIVAGEASGDQLGGGLVRALRQHFPDAIIEGITGPEMEAAGCRTWGSYEQLAVMGLVEVLGHLPRIMRLKKSLEERILASPPDVFIGIDAPDFNLRVEKKLRKNGIKTIHYVCPSVWAWRSSRVKTIRAACDLVLCLLPFEKEFLNEHGVQGVFTGHSMADDIVPLADRSAARQRLNIDEAEVVGVLPGSRMGEMKYLGPAFIDAARWLVDRRPALRFVVPAARPRIRAGMEKLIAEAGLQQHFTVLDGQARDVMQAADVVLLASGTATLETMLVGRPMVVSYKVSALTAWLLRNSGLVNIERFSLPNLLADSELVPEILQEDATGPKLGAAVLNWLEHPDERGEVEARFVELGALLRKDASRTAAAAVADLLNKADHT